MTSGLKEGDFDSLNVAYGIGVGTKFNNGLKGEALMSGGSNTVSYTHLRAHET